MINDNFHTIDDRLTFKRVIDVIGEKAALILCEQFGGKPLWIPQAGNVKPGHQLAQAIGLEKAQIMADLWGGDRIASVPITPLKQMIVWRMRDQGLPVPKIASEVHMTVSGVYSMLRKPRPNSKQSVEETPPLLAIMSGGVNK